MSGFTISGVHTDDMNARVFIIISVHALISNCVTVNVYNQAPEIITTSKIELTPILITGGLNDIVVLSVPILNSQAVYYLHRPNGDALRLDLKDNKVDKKNSTNHVRSNKQFTIFKIKSNESCCAVSDTLAAAEANMTPYDFIIGPLQEQDHGNWVLSLYFQDLDGQWIELFQVITVEIIETVPLSPEKLLLNIGDTFLLSFAYPLSELESCQIEPPRSTFDRFYDRTRTRLDQCEFIMKNVTLADEGIWTINGVGRIVYKGTASLHVQDTK